MKVVINYDLCISCGNCVDICPEIFKMAENEAYTVIDEIDESMKDACEIALLKCPVSAIKMEEWVVWSVPRGLMNQHYIT